MPNIANIGQSELEVSKQSIQKVTDELLQCHTQVQQLLLGEKKLQQRITELEYEVLAKEKELLSTEKLVEVTCPFHSV